MGRRVSAEADEAPLADANRRRNSAFHLRLSRKGLSRGLDEVFRKVRKEQPDLSYIEQCEVAIERLGLTEDYEFLLKGGSWMDLN